MAIALVPGQLVKTPTTGSVTTVTATLPNNPTPGNLVIAWLAIGSDTVSGVTVKDGAGTPNNYTATSKSPFLAVLQMSGIWYLPNAPATANKAVTATWVGANGGTLWIGEFSGAATSPFENDATASTNGSLTSITTPSYTTLNDGDLLVSAVGSGGNVTAAGAPWTLCPVDASNGEGAEYFIQTTHGAQAVAYTQSAGSSTAIIAAFKAASPQVTKRPVRPPFTAGPFRNRRQTKAYPPSSAANTLSLAGGTYTFTGTAVTLNISIPLSGGTYTYIGTDLASLDVKLPLSGGTYTYTGTAASLDVQLPLSGSTYTYTGTSTTLGAAVNINSGSYVVNGTAASLNAHLSILPASGSYVYTGTSATLNVSLPLSGGSYTYTGTPSTLSVNLPLSSGSYTYTGTAATLNVGISAGSGSYVYSGSSLTPAVAITLNSGSYLYNGTDATLTYQAHGNLSIVISSGSYVYTGTAATLNVGINASGGSYTYTGSSLTPAVAITLSSGSYLYTGTASTLTYQTSRTDFTLALSSGSYADTGFSVNLNYQSGQTPTVGGRVPEDWLVPPAYRSNWAKVTQSMIVHDAAVRLGTKGGIASGISRRIR